MENNKVEELKEKIKTILKLSLIAEPGPGHTVYEIDGEFLYNKIKSLVNE